MDGWCSVEDLTRWGFAQASVVMANEAHSGLAQPDLRALISTENALT